MYIHYIFYFQPPAKSKEDIAEPSAPISQNITKPQQAAAAADLIGLGNK